MCTKQGAADTLPNLSVCFWLLSTAYPDQNNKLALLNTKLYINKHTHTNLQLTIESTFLIVRTDKTCTRYKHTSPLAMYICIHNNSFEELYKRAVYRSEVMTVHTSRISLQLYVCISRWACKTFDHHQCFQHAEWFTCSIIFLHHCVATSIQYDS